MEQNLGIANLDVTKILVITSTIQKPERKMYLDITNECQHATEKMNAKQTNKDGAP